MLLREPSFTSSGLKFEHSNFGFQSNFFEETSTTEFFSSSKLDKTVDNTVDY